MSCLVDRGGGGGGRRGEQVLHAAARGGQERVLHHPDDPLHQGPRTQGPGLQHRGRPRLAQGHHGYLRQDRLPQRTGGRERIPQRGYVLIMSQPLL